MPAFLIYGTFMRDQPGHANLDGARFVEPAETAPRYRLFEIDERWPAPGWASTPVELSDGRRVDAFLGSPDLRARGIDVSGHGGWAAYRASCERGS